MTTADYKELTVQISTETYDKISSLAQEMKEAGFETFSMNEAIAYVLENGLGAIAQLPENLPKRKFYKELCKTAVTLIRTEKGFSFQGVLAATYGDGIIPLWAINWDVVVVMVEETLMDERLIPVNDDFFTGNELVYAAHPEDYIPGLDWEIDDSRTLAGYIIAERSPALAKVWKAKQQEEDQNAMDRTLKDLKSVSRLFPSLEDIEEMWKKKSN